MNRKLIKAETCCRAKNERGTVTVMTFLWQQASNNIKICTQWNYQWTMKAKVLFSFPPIRPPFHHKWFTILCFSFEMKTYQLLSQDHILIKSFSTPLLVCSTSVFILIWTIWADSCSSQSETLLSRAPHDDLKVWSSYLESRLSISFMEVGQMLSEQKNVERNVWSACLCN